MVGTKFEVFAASHIPAETHWRQVDAGGFYQNAHRPAANLNGFETDQGCRYKTLTDGLGVSTIFLSRQTL